MTRARSNETEEKKETRMRKVKVSFSLNRSIIISTNFPDRKIKEKRSKVLHPYFIFRTSRLSCSEIVSPFYFFLSPLFPRSSLKIV